MDESGGSGRPRTDEATERHERPQASPGPAADAPRPGPAGSHPYGGPEPAAPGDDEPRRPSGAPSGAPGADTAANGGPGARASASDKPAGSAGDGATGGAARDRDDEGAGSAPRGAGDGTEESGKRSRTDSPEPAGGTPDSSERDTVTEAPDGPRAPSDPVREARSGGDDSDDAPTSILTKPAGTAEPREHPTSASAAAPVGDARTRARSEGGGGQPPRRGREPGGGLLMGRPFGVPVYVAPSWFLVAALITWVFGGQLDRVLPELGAARYLVSLFFAVAFYASVLVHELAHTVAALRFKLPVRRIQLQFFGGVSEIEKEAETPGREFVLAFVGPLLSLVLSGVFYLAMQTVEPGTVPGVLLAGLMISNLIVAAFNLLPGLPLDGGRMLRAVVWKVTGKPMSGTVAAAWFGRALAVSVLIGLPLLTQSGLVGDAPDDIGGMDTVTDALLAAILAAIIWTGAGNSLRMARLREHLPELRARSLTRRAVPVETDTPLSEALRRANEVGARALVVVDADGEPLSLVREAAIVGVPEHRRPWVAVSGLAQDLTDGMRVSAELAGEELLDVLRATPATEYLVVEESGEIYGVLSAADVERAFVKAMARHPS
ncbi:peptidase [Streptomyces sp. Tue6028]|uniref:site-2 protease family protein n=1 Tax=Streptomyces sp. Tue6028 TaxID=2036037 RepID=UPI000BB3D6C6|nr:site-2 protease family protein [Streptomyces sp. Tue6028]PBC64898.1 peptidase [Streptomyces sp. Tue6028]